MKTRLIESSEVTRYTPVRSGVDTDVINANIETTQDLILAYVLGYNLMKRLQDLVDGTTPDQGDGRYQALLDGFVSPYLRWATAYTMLPEIAISIGSGGIQNPESNQGSSVFDGQMAIVKQNILSKAQGYKTLLLDHLCDKSNLYPEYQTYEQGRQNKTDNGKPFHGIQFY
jgi:hypothetical protein